MHNDIYYRIYLSHRSEKLTVVCMQDFDEDDYDVHRFMTDEDGDRLRFEFEEEAIDWLNKHVKREYIDEAYLVIYEDNEEDDESEEESVGLDRDKYLR